MYSFLVENGDFFPIWLTEYTYSVKTVTVIASFQKRSPKWRFFKTLAVYVWTDENGTCRIRDAVQYIIYYQHDACSVRDAISTHFHCKAFSYGRAKTIRIRYTWTHTHLKTRKNISVFKNIRILVACGPIWEAFWLLYILLIDRNDCLDLWSVTLLFDALQIVRTNSSYIYGLFHIWWKRQLKFMLSVFLFFSGNERNNWSTLLCVLFWSKSWMARSVVWIVVKTYKHLQ